MERVSKKGSPANPFTRADLVRDIKNVGIEAGDTIHVKISMRSIGKIDGGANTLISALMDVIGPEGTLIADSFINMYPLPLSADHAKIISDEKSPSYAGYFANAMIKYPGVERSRHPVQKFTAIGARAKELMEKHGPDSYAYDVLRVISEEGAKNLKIGPEHEVTGVGTTHVAIGQLYLKQERPSVGVNYRAKNGDIKLFEINWSGAPCEKGFHNFFPYYEKADAYLGRSNIGNAPSTLTSMSKTLKVEMDLLRENPAFMFCNDPSCVNCRLSWEFSSGNAALVHTLAFFKNISKKSPSRFINKMKKKYIK